MASQRKITLSDSESAQAAELRRAIEAAQRELLAAEADLAREQAEVNAFRLQCRLKLDRWIEQLMALQAERQSLLTRAELRRQAGPAAGSFARDDPFWSEEEDEDGEAAGEEEELLLPTDVPLDKEAEKRLYRELARRFHPDLGQTALEIAYRTEMMSAVNQAYAAADSQALYDLAGELDPEEASALAAIGSREVRRLKQQLIRLQQRRRRTGQRLVVLREENTARLWRKARRLEKDDTHWWEVVRQEIEGAIERLEAEIARLIELVEPAEVAEDDAAAE
jgi:hypothetical protein